MLQLRALRRQNKTFTRVALDVSNCGNLYGGSPHQLPHAEVTREPPWHSCDCQMRVFLEDSDAAPPGLPGFLLSSLGFHETSETHPVYHPKMSEAEQAPVAEADVISFSVALSASLAAGRSVLWLFEEMSVRRTERHARRQS